MHHTLNLLLPHASSRVHKSLDNQKIYHDLKVREREISIGNMVFIQSFGKGPKLLSGIITERHGQVSFNIYVIYVCAPLFVMYQLLDIVHTMYI